ncbi:MAG: hypothetical protein M3Q08_11930 [Pseudomonadota bacterium]|nr:hypothetical protein [Pseudomonadota bacterium]
MPTITIIPPRDVAPTDELEMVRAALHVPAGTHFVVDATGLTAIQVQRQQDTARRVTALVEVPLGQQLTGDQLVAALVALNVLPRNPGEVAAVYGRIGLLSETRPTPELTARTKQATPEAPNVSVNAADTQSPEPLSLQGDTAESEPEPDVADTPPVVVPDERTAPTADTKAADLVPCGYGNCQVRKAVGRPIKMHRIRGHGLVGGELPGPNVANALPVVQGVAAPAAPLPQAVEQPDVASGRTASTAAAVASTGEPPLNF